MSSYFDEPDENDDGAFVTIRFNETLCADHPAMLIRKFVSTLDLSLFEDKYKVGPSQKGRPPKGIRMMLGLLLYAIYSRIYSAHQIEYAAYNYSDFWIFTHKNEISHDKISDFINLHEAEIINVFLETIILADRNDLLDFKALYQDGFFVKANASRKKNYKMKSLNNREQKILEALRRIMNNFKETEESEDSRKSRRELESKLEKVTGLKKELNEKIKDRLNRKRKDKVNVKDISINETDKASSIMKMKDNSFSNAYLKVTAVDSKSDIIVGSIMDGYCDESHNAVKLFKESNRNCSNLGKYDEVCFDSGFNTMGTSVGFESMGITVIAPTKEYENETRNPEKHEKRIKFEYSEDKHEVKCSENKILFETERYHDSDRGTIIYKFSNPDACRNCVRVEECTTSKEGFRTVKVDSRQACQQRVLERYKSEEGQNIYKRRSHSAETFQGDMKQNGKYDKFFRRGIKKVKVESTLLDIAWNLRRIFNTAGQNLIWSTA